jgi:uncharacterized protein YggE
LKKQGISADRIHAAKFSSTPKHWIFSEKAKSYRIENLMRVAVQDEKEFQGAAGAVDLWTEVQFAGVEFEYADRESSKKRAVSQACDIANERAKMFEEKFGLKLTPRSFSEGIAGQREMQAGNYGISTKQLYTSEAASSAAPTAVAADESISSFGELVYTARVTVEYTVQPK